MWGSTPSSIPTRNTIGNSSPLAACSVISVTASTAPSSSSTSATSATSCRKLARSAASPPVVSSYCAITVRSCSTFSSRSSPPSSRSRKYSTYPLSSST